MDMDGGPSGWDSRRRAPPAKKAPSEPALPDFLRTMINDVARKKATENKVKLHWNKEDGNDAQVHALLQWDKDLVAQVGLVDTAGGREHRQGAGEGSFRHSCLNVKCAATRPSGAGTGSLRPGARGSVAAEAA